MNSKKVILYGAAICLLALLSPTRLWCKQSDDPMQQLSKKEREIVKAYEKKYLNETDLSASKFFTDSRIDSHQVVSGSVEVIKANLHISGKVTGTVLAFFSKLQLDSSAVIEGNLVSVNGELERHELAMVQGDVIESYTSTAETDDYDRRPDDRPWQAWPWAEDRSEDGYIDYNRVDGLTLGLQLPRPEWWEKKGKSYALLGRIGYSFLREHLQYQVGLERHAFDQFRFSLGGELHDLTDSEDRWIISDSENALAAALMREDFRDYYSRSGYKLYLNQHLGRSLQLQAEYRWDQIGDLAQIARWSLFGGHKKFATNPPVLPIGFFSETGAKEIELKNVLAYSVVYDDRDHPSRPERGWLMQGSFETGQAGKGDFYHYRRAILDLRRYQPLGREETISVRLRAGSSIGLQPPLYWFDLGGLSTLRGYRFKSLTGNRMVLANAEYRINTSGGDWSVLEAFDLVFFVDSGYAWFTEVKPDGEDYRIWPGRHRDADILMAGQSLDDGFDRLTWKQLKTNVGIGLASRDGDFRIDLAKPTDHQSNKIMVTLRLQRSF